MQSSDGNLVVYRADGTAVWSTGAWGAGTRAVMQSDGNLVLYRGSVARWHTATTMHAGAELALHDDGSLIVWAGGKPVWTWQAGYLGDSLLRDWKLAPGSRLRSANGRFSLVMQTDGNLVLYEGGTARWWTDAQGAGTEGILQGDGNFVLYRGGVARWWTDTGRLNVERLMLHDDGSLNVWAGGRPVWTRFDGYVGDRLRPGWELKPGFNLRSPNGSVELRMQTDGNLVLYQAGTARWWTGVHAPGSHAVLQTDGNFVEYTGSTPRWDSRSMGQGGDTIRAQDDGNLVLYRATQALWSSAFGPHGGPNVYGSPDWWPLRGENRVGCAYNSPGSVCHGDYHSWWAIDIDAAHNQPIYSAGAGLAKVHSRAQGCTGSGYGNAVVVEHGGSTRSLYAHMSSFSSEINANPGGVWVGPTTVIGYVGNTGNVVPCSHMHLHYERRNGATPIDPGSLLGCITARVAYPSFWGRGSWSQLPGQTFHARNDRVNC
jgi:hypothetical protein